MPRDPRRDQLLDSAARLFAERGFVATTVNAVAEEAGVTKPGLYYHVRSKVDLLNGICRESIEAILARIEERSAAATGDPVAQLSTMIAVHVGFFADHPHRLTVLNREMAHLTPNQRHHVKGLQRRYLDRLRRVIEAGIASGRFHCVDSTVSAFLLLAMVNNLDAWYRPGAAVDHHGVVAHVQRLYLHGLIDHPPSETVPE